MGKQYYRQFLTPQHRSSLFIHRLVLPFDNSRYTMLRGFQRAEGQNRLGCRHTKKEYDIGPRSVMPEGMMEEERVLYPLALEPILLIM